MSASAYAERGGDSTGLGPGRLEFLKWQSAQVAVTRRPACVVLAILCMIPVLVYYGAGGSSNTSLERLVGFSSFGPSSSLGLCIVQAALFLLVACLSKPGHALKGGELRLYSSGSLVIISLLFSVLLCPSCILAFTASPAPHGVTHSAVLFTISCFLIDPSLLSALPAAAAMFASNICFIAFAPRDTAVYYNFM
jgi:hypothetical protein